MSNVYDTERQTECIFSIFCSRYLEHHATLLSLRDRTYNDTELFLSLSTDGQLLNSNKIEIFNPE